MSSWVVIPCLLCLRDEFNALSPNRDKGADGTIGDSSHTSSSDHTADEDSDKLKAKDSDKTNEVHALDIDSSGPWPAGRTFKSIVLDIIEREKAKWLDPHDMCRLNYVIFDRKIYDKDNDFEPENYTGSDPHTNHAHFSARYETQAENDTRPWGVLEDADMPLNDADKTWIENTTRNAVLAGLNGGLGDVVQRWTNEGELVPATDPNPYQTPASAMYYTGATARRTELSAAEAAAEGSARLASIEATLIQFGSILAELVARPAGSAPTTSQLIDAITEVLRDGVSE